MRFILPHFLLDRKKVIPSSVSPDSHLHPTLPASPEEGQTRRPFSSLTTKSFASPAPHPAAPGRKRKWPGRGSSCFFLSSFLPPPPPSRALQAVPATGAADEVTEARAAPAAAGMEDSHYNSSYFWTPIPTVAGQFENVMFINKIKEQLLTDKSCPTASYQSPPQHSGGADPSGTPGETKPPVPSPSSDGVTILPLPSATLMTGLVISPCSGPSATATSTLPSLSLASPLSAGETLPTPPEKKPPSGEDAAQSPKPPGPRKRKCRHVEGGVVVPFPGSSEEEASRDGRSYRCRTCPLTFLSKSDMQLHSKSHSESKPHHCPHCSKTFANSSYLAQHVRIHSGAKPYACSYCQRNFRQLSHLQQHTRIHTGDRPYKCAQPGCEKSFTQLSNLQSHRRQHNKDKPFKCPHCHRAYTDSPSLQVHLSTHTVKHIKAFACNSCRKTYTSETYLMKHMKKHKVPDRQPEAFEAPAGVQVEGRDPAPCPYDLFKADAREEACLSSGGLRVDTLGTS